MIKTLLIVLIAILVSAITTYTLLHKRLKASESYNRVVIKENEQNLRLKEQLETEIRQLYNNKAQIQIDITEANKNLSYLNNFLEERKANIENEIQNTAKTAEITMSSQLDEAADRKRKEQLDAIEAAKQEYEMILREDSVILNDQIEEKRLTITDLEQTLESLRQKVLAVNEENKRQEEIKTKSDFYRLQISEIDLKEVQKLREIGKELRDPAPLNKMIWTYYFRNLWSDLSGRVVGSGVRSGIYKITNLENGMAYIGQAVNIRDRWSTHIKTGLGAETPTRNKLYPAMLAFGVENFTFEVLEECPSELLNEREKFYIEFYDTTNYGYNVTRGGS